MRRVYLLCSLLFIVAVHGPNLQAQVDTQSVTFLTSALRALGSMPVNDVTLAANVRRINGSNDETVTASYEAMLSGSTQTIFQSSTGSLSETRVWSANSLRAGIWVDQQGKSHPLAYHNMMTEPSWFFPMLTLERVLAQNSGLKVSYIGPENFHGSSVQHLTIVSSALNDDRLRSLSQTELYLDATTLQPVSLTYNEHPDSSALVNIAVRVVFSGYKFISTVTLPTEIKQYRNEALALDITVQNVSVNTGLTITSPKSNSGD